MRWKKLPAVAGVVLLALMAACGGGGSSSFGPSGSPEPVLAITSVSPLPGTLRNHSYSVTLAAANGDGALHWSIDRVTPTTGFVDGLALDPSTGVLSGPPISPAHAPLPLSSPTPRHRLKQQGKTFRLTRLILWRHPPLRPALSVNSRNL